MVALTSGTDRYNHTCVDGQYVCFPDCNNHTVGALSIQSWQNPAQRAKDCTAKSSDFECWYANLPWMMTNATPGYWYSTQQQVRCERVQRLLLFVRRRLLRCEAIIGGWMMRGVVCLLRVTVCVCVLVVVAFKETRAHAKRRPQQQQQQPQPQQ